MERKERGGAGNPFLQQTSKLWFTGPATPPHAQSGGGTKTDAQWMGKAKA